MITKAVMSIKPKQQKLLLTLLLLLPVSILCAITVGSVPLPLVDTIKVLIGNTQQLQFANSELIITQIHLPRTLLAAMVGALLAASGTATQGLFRNPLADPSLIGVTAGASAGASIVIVFGGSSFVVYWSLS